MRCFKIQYSSNMRTIGLIISEMNHNFVYLYRALEQCYKKKYIFILTLPPGDHPLYFEIKHIIYNIGSLFIVEYNPNRWTYILKCLEDKET